MDLVVVVHIIQILPEQEFLVKEIREELEDPVVVDLVAVICFVEEVVEAPAVLEQMQYHLKLVLVVLVFLLQFQEYQ